MLLLVTMASRGSFGSPPLSADHSTGGLDAAGERGRLNATGRYMGFLVARVGRGLLPLSARHGIFANALILHPLAGVADQGGLRSCGTGTQAAAAAVGSFADVWSTSRWWRVRRCSFP